MIAKTIYDEDSDDAVKDELRAAAEDRANHHPKPQGNHCGVCGLRWPCDGYLEAELITEVLKRWI